jgi:DNA polymerase I-like protein with 3'-5' exonuclease and polymerase domains
METYFFVDLETTADGGPKGDSPEAQWAWNRIILCGWQQDTGGIHIDTDLVELTNAIIVAILDGKLPIIVAHNAKFDLKYLYRFGSNVDWRRCEVWDTMTWEYLHSGHRNKFAGLEATATSYGIPFTKSLDLGALLKSGLKMQDIPISDLTTYLREDVRVLRDIWIKQTQTGTHYDTNHIMPLAEMELNGLYIDRPKLVQEFSAMTTVVDQEEDKMQDHIQQVCCWQDGSEVKLEDFSDALGVKSKYLKTHAGRTLSFLLTGNPTELNITPKWKLRFKPGKLPHHAGRLPSYYKNPTHLGYPIDETVLLKDKNWITRSAYKHRKANKIVGTYLSPFLESMNIAGGYVYPKMNTAQTNTGRLSSSNPNGQNIPPIVRSLVTTQHGWVYEIDFKQLEMVAVACISKCPDMLAALKRGDDLHFLSGRKVFGWTTPADMTDADRTTVKAVNFGLLYGGKAKGLSYLTGVNQAIIQDLIDGFYAAFPGVARWQKKVFNEVVDNMYPYDTKDGSQRYASMWTSPIGGRKWCFVEKEAPGWVRKKTGRGWSFSPTHTSNYPIQGFAGGDIVMYALTWLWRHHTTYRYILTVHDSIVVESQCDKQMIEAAVEQMCRATVLHFNLPLDLVCDVDQGTHWK